MKVIKIGAVWCSGCLVMKPRWEEIEKENPWLETEYLDFDRDEEDASVFKVEEDRLPVFIFLDKKGKEILRVSGEIEKKEITELISENRDK